MDDAIAETSLTILLVVTEISPFSKLMAMRLGGEDRTVHVVDDIASFRSGVEEHQPDIVVMDGAIDFAPELRQWLKSIPRQQLTSLVAYYPKENDPAEGQGGFRVREDQCLVEPYEIDELNEMIDSEAQRLTQERKYFIHEVKFEMPSLPTYVNQGGDFLEQLAKNSGLAEEDWMALVNAGREAMDNGARHGNGGEEAKTLQVAYVQDRKKITLSVEDEGGGFDVGKHLGDGIEGDAVALARKRHQQGKVGGLGIMLMLRCVDKLEYNPQGSVVKLTKNLDTAS